MSITVSSMFIPVHDPDAALGFYRDALGLEAVSYTHLTLPTNREV